MTLIEETIAAGRGVMALILGRRNASSYFDLTLTGLVGSFIAFFVTSGINTHATQVMVNVIATEEFQLPPEAALQGWQALFVIIVTYAIRMGFAALALNWMKRLDGFIPFVIANNWVDFFSVVVVLVLALFGFGGGGVALIFIVVIFLVQINIARLIVTLRPMQILFFLITQVFGTLLVMSVLAGIFLPMPVTP